MKPVLLGAAVLLIQVFAVGCYYTLLAVLDHRSSMRVWLASSVLLTLLVFVAVKSVCHECLTLPSVAQCQRSGSSSGSSAGIGAIDMQLHSTRIGGHIEARRLGDCTFYWHENNTGGD